MLRLAKSSSSGTRAGRAIAAGLHGHRPFSSSSTSTSSTSSKRRAGGMGALLAVMAAADVGFSNYQQAEADRRATAALLRGGAALPPLPGDSGDMDTMPGMKAGAVDGMDRTGLQRRVQGLVAPRALGRGGHVVVSGPKGSGKSTLLRQAAAAQGPGVLYIDLRQAAATATCSGSSNDGAIVETAVRRALGLDAFPVYQPHRSLLELAYGAAVRDLSGSSGGEGQEVERALRLLQRALVKAQQQGSSPPTSTQPPPSIILDHLEALSPAAAVRLQDWAAAVSASSSPLASTVVLAADSAFATAALRGRAAWGAAAATVEVSDLTETEALSFLTSAVPHLSEADAARLIILLGGRPQHLRRAAAALREEGKTVEDVALEACESMQGGFDRLLSLPRTAFLSSNSNATAPIKEGETPLPPAHGLLAALLRQPSRTLTLPQAAAALGLPPPSSDHDDDDGSNLAHRLLTEQGPALTLLPPIHIGGNPRVGFASPLAERFGHAYLHHIGTGTGGSGGETDNKKNHVSAGPPVARALVAALMGLDPFKKEEKGGGGAGRFVSTTALVAAGAAGLYLTAAMGGAGGSVSSVFLHLPLQGAWWSDNVDKWARAAHGAAQASAAVAKDAACAVAGRLAAGAAALGERLAAAMAAAAKAGTGRRPGEE